VFLVHKAVVWAPVHCGFPVLSCPQHAAWDPKRSFWYMKLNRVWV